MSGWSRGPGVTPGSVVQGKTRPDPLESELLRAPHVRTLHIEPVNAYRQTCNILYPRALLERLDGFDEQAVAGEDVGLSLRAERAGAKIVAAPDALVYHAVESHSLPGIVRQNLKWRYLAYLVKNHPEFRRELTLGVFWDEDHMLITAAAAGALGARRHPVLGVLAAPWLVSAFRRRGRSAPVAAGELPGAAIRQFAEVLGLAAGSVRHRTLLL